MATAEEPNQPGLPSGFLTFVFTDIEGSTRLYKQLGESVAGDVFDQHNELLRTAWANHDGYEIHTEGDSFFVVFERPDDAIAACCQVQQGIANAAWPDDVEVRVRIGIHCGVALPRNGDYMALPVHQASRVMSAAHGGQILITDHVAGLLSNPSDALLSTGAFRLRDFTEPPELIRVDVDGVEPNTAPPRATPARQHNLVAAITSFVGREADLVTINGLLTPGALVTVVGLGGMGKTRLATEVGLKVADDWTDGVWMVELADIDDADLIPDEVARALGAPSTVGSDRWSDVLTHAADKHLLVIFDNVEHLAERCGELIPELLRTCRNVSVLATSREPLNCQGETLYRLQPLTVDNNNGGTGPPPSVALFLDRAHAASPAQSFDGDALDDVREICSHLDGMPLAIEVAAAQVAVLQINEIRSGLTNRFRLLRSRDRSLPERQRTMEGLLGWSYQLLTEDEQRAFRRLAVFAGSFSIDAAEATIAGDDIDPDDVPELIWTLVDKSLIAADLSDSATRYRMFESVQQYAMRLLLDSDDPVALAVRHANWLLEHVAPWQVNDRRWLGQVAIEATNIRGTVDLVTDVAPELAQQLLCSIGRYHDTMQSYSTGIDELQRGAEATPETPSLVAVLAELAYLHLRRANIDAAAAVLASAAELQGRVGPPSWNPVALERSQCELAIRTSEFAAASALADETLQRGAPPRGSAHMWSVKGIAEAMQGNGQAGLDALDRALEIYLELDDVAHIVGTRGNVAEAAWRVGHVDKAAATQLQCLADALAIGHQVAIANSLIMAARIAAQHERWSDTVQLHSHAEALLAEAGYRLYDDDHDELVSEARTAAEVLGADEVEQLGQAGRAMNVLDAAELATSILNAELVAPSACSSTQRKRP